MRRRRGCPWKLYFVEIRPQSYGPCIFVLQLRIVVTIGDNDNGGYAVDDSHDDDIIEENQPDHSASADSTGETAWRATGRRRPNLS